MLFLELNAPDQILETINFQVGFVSQYCFVALKCPFKCPFLTVISIPVT